MASRKGRTLLVIQEQHFVRNGSEVYTDVQSDSSFWERYLAVFDRLVVCARMRDAAPNDDLGGMLRSTHPRVEFVGLPDFQGATGPVKNFSVIGRTLRGSSIASTPPYSACRAPSRWLPTPLCEGSASLGRPR